MFVCFFFWGGKEVQLAFRERDGLNFLSDKVLGAEDGVHVAVVRSPAWRALVD